MEFNEKLQELRKQRGLTQEELAQNLYVSRTAISKWESGRGYPSIDSLKAISGFFGVTIDAMLSGDELLTIAEADHKQKKTHSRNLIFGALDLSTLLFLFLPFFGQTSGGTVQTVGLLALTEISPVLRISYLLAVVFMISSGILNLILGMRPGFDFICPLSLICSGAGTLLFILSPQPYAAAFLFLFLAIKVLIQVKMQ